MKKKELTRDRMMEVLSYDPETGFFTRRKSGSGVVAGQRAETPHDAGRLRIAVDRVRYYAHRLAWLYVYGEWPNDLIDHINGDPTDNRIDNLREATHSLNMQNQRRAHEGSSSGILGVYKRRNKFSAQIELNGKNRSLGSFKSAEDAHARYLQVKREIHAGGTI